MNHLCQLMGHEYADWILVGGSIKRYCVRENCFSFQEIRPVSEDANNFIEQMKKEIDLGIKMAWRMLNK